MNNKIKKGNLNYDQSGRAYPDNPQIKENWNCIWEKDGKHYKLVGDNEHKEWEEIENQYKVMNKEQQGLLGDAYENWCKQFEVDPNNFNGEELANGHNDQCWGYPILDHVKPTSKEYKRGQINAYLEGKAEQPFFYLTQEEFIGRVITNPDFAKQWGVTIYTVVEDGNTRIGINYNDKTIESYEN